MLILFCLKSPANTFDAVEYHRNGEPFPAIGRVDEQTDEKNNVELVGVVEYLTVGKLIYFISSLV